MIRHYCNNCGKEIETKSMLDEDSYKINVKGKVDNSEIQLVIKAFSPDGENLLKFDWCTNCILKALIDHYDEWTCKHKMRPGAIKVVEEPFRSNY